MKGSNQCGWEAAEKTDLSEVGCDGKDGFQWIK
jgi:hypothetical protein